MKSSSTMMLFPLAGIVLSLPMAAAFFEPDRQSSIRERDLGVSQIERKLPLPKKKTTHKVSFSGGHSGCMQYSTAQLQSMWAASGNSGSMPSCSYNYHGGGSNGGSNGGGSGSGGGNNNGGGNNGGNGEDGQGNNNDGGAQNSGEGNDGNDGNDGDGTVTNEDVNNQQGGNNNNGNYNNGDERDSDPYTDFQLDKCDTYENLWVWDAELYCSDINNMAQCTCEYAQGLMSLGELQCSDIDSCPDDCSICKSCLTVICGLSDASQASSKGNGLTNKVSTNSLVLICVGAGILIFAVFYLMARRHDDEDEDLSASLLSSGAGTENVWLVPDSPPAAGPRHHCDTDLMADHYEDFGPQGGDNDDVWLAPVS